MVIIHDTQDTPKPCQWCTETPHALRRFSGDHARLGAIIVTTIQSLPAEAKARQPHERIARSVVVTMLLVFAPVHAPHPSTSISPGLDGGGAIASRAGKSCAICL